MMTKKEVQAQEHKPVSLEVWVANLGDSYCNPVTIAGQVQNKYVCMKQIIIHA